MIINDLELPASFVNALNSGRLDRSRGSWQLLQDCDSDGHPLETELSEMYRTEEKIQAETDALPESFQPDGYYGESSPDMAGPGAIPDIVDFSQIVCFGSAGGGEPFCFDFRDSIERPSVIWWDDAYWRKVSPDFEAFLNLFDFSSQ